MVPSPPSARRPVLPDSRPGYRRSTDLGDGAASSDSLPLRHRNLQRVTTDGPDGNRSCAAYAETCGFGNSRLCVEREATSCWATETMLGANRLGVRFFR